MDLQFRGAHLSITDAPGTSLPEFTVLTGVNGSGKTHFLRAIERKAIQLTEGASELKEVKFYDWNSLIPSNSSTVHSHQLYAPRDQLQAQILQIRQQHADSMSQQLQPLGIITSAPWSLVNATDARWASLGANNPRQAKTTVDNHIKAAVKQLEALGAPTRTLASSNGLELRDLLTVDLDTLNTQKVLWGQSDIFQQSFASLFLLYHELQKNNYLADYYVSKGAHLDPSLSEVEFEKRHGPPPWDFVNRVLGEAGLDFAIDNPLDPTVTQYTPKLTKISSGATVNFADLSSGEKVLMSFAFCMYHASDGRQDVTRPDVLLLDEIDAPLHPRMAKTLLHTVENTLVRKFGVRVILTTHSPSTVALAPESALRVLTGSPAKLQTVTKRQAISVLTTDVPTLSLEFSGRRQVFTESDNDANYLASLYRWLTPKIKSERSLDFVGVGIRTASGDQGAGSSIVRKLVPQIADSGNQSVFGLVDWDAKNQPHGRVHVLAGGSRYSLENLLLDPLLMLAFLVRERHKEAVAVGVPDGLASSKLQNTPPTDLQAWVTAVENRVLGTSPTDQARALRKVGYNDGQFALELSEAFCNHQGHELWPKATAALPPLRKFQSEGAYHSYVAGDLCRELPELVPDDLLAAFRSLLDANP